MTTPLKRPPSVVQPQQCNELGHMKVEHYFAAVSEASHVLMADLGLEGTADHPPDASFAVVHADTDFKASLSAGEDYQVIYWVAAIGTRSATFEYRINRIDDGAVAFETRFKSVLLGAEDGKAQEIPVDLRRALDALILKDTE